MNTSSTTIRRRDAPIYALKIYTAGQPAERADDVTARLISADFDDEESKADKLTLTLDNFDLSVFDDPRWKKGNYLQFTWGYSGNVAPTRTCTIQKMTGFQALQVVALAGSVLMNKKTRSRMFENMTRAQVATKIAGEYGYAIGSAAFIDETNVVLPSISQARLTDAQFLKSLAAREGFEFYVDWEGLHWKRRKVGSAPVRQFIFYTDPSQGDVLGISIDNNVTITPGAVNAKGRDPLGKKTIDVTASNADTQRDGTADVLEVVDPRTKTTQTAPIAVDTTYHTNASTGADAKREADGRFIKAQQAVVLLSMDIIGDPGVTAKQVIEILGISRRLSGRYYVRAAKHKITATSYTCSLSCRSDGGHNAQVGAAKSDAAKNGKDVLDPSALAPIEIVNARTKETVVVYRPGGASR